MASHITPPSPFLPHSGQPEIEWEDWLEMFNNYLLAMDGQEFSPERKKALLLNALGKEGQHIFKYLPIALRTNGQPVDDAFEEAKQRLNTHFTKESNLVLTRYKFTRNHSWNMNQ